MARPTLRARKERVEAEQEGHRRVQRFSAAASHHVLLPGTADCDGKYRRRGIPKPLFCFETMRPRHGRATGPGLVSFL